jgi:hypothetical protein
MFANAWQLPGEYPLKSTGEVVVNPNFLCSYDIYPRSD